VKLYPNYRKVIFFEPSELNMAAAKRRLAGFQNIEFHSSGLSDASGTLGFDPKSGSASSIQQHGLEKIIVEKLDHAVSEPVTFIKMDLEGWEVNALRGSHRHIKLDRPKLAIAVYHHASDLRLIYEYINSFDHKYKVYLRHYTQGWSETVMYFL
jgi:FkbM family methyltransferase